MRNTKIILRTWEAANYTESERDLVEVGEYSEGDGRYHLIIEIRRDKDNKIYRLSSKDPIEVNLEDFN